MNDPQQQWGGFDDSLDDVPAGEAPPPARPWLSDQRLMHGLLRHLHNQDAQAREARVQGVLARLPAEAARPNGWLVAAAALLLAVGGYWLLGAASMPSAEAAVARAAGLLGQDVDRRFTLSVHEQKAGADGRQMAEFELTTRPGMHFLLDGHFEARSERMVPVRIGCDGSEVWVKMPNMSPLAQPLDRAAMLMAMAGDVLDLGYLDIQALMQRLPQGFELACVGTDTGSDGHRLLRIRATQLPDRMQERVQSLTMICDDDTGMVTRIEIDATPRWRSPRSIVLQYVGTVEVGVDAYKKP